MFNIGLPLHRFLSKMLLCRCFYLAEKELLIVRLTIYDIINSCIRPCGQVCMALRAAKTLFVICLKVRVRWARKNSLERKKRIDSLRINEQNNGARFPCCALCIYSPDPPLCLFVDKQSLHRINCFLAHPTQRRRNWRPLMSGDCNRR